MARLFPSRAVDRFLEHNVFYTMGQCTIQEGLNGFKRGASRSGGQAGRAHDFANNWLGIGTAKTRSWYSSAWGDEDRRGQPRFPRGPPIGPGEAGKTPAPATKFGD